MLRLSLLILIGTLVWVPLTAQSTTVQVPLTWERSTEPATNWSAGLGGSVSAALTLPTPLTAAWDNGTYATNLEADCKSFAVAQKRTWASWSHLSACASTYETRLLKAKFDLALPGLPVDVTLYTPSYRGLDIVPINDNFYFYVNVNTLIGKRGTSYGAIHNGNYLCTGTPSMLAPETDGWYTPGSFGAPPLGAFVKGANTLEVVGEEYCGWGGIGEMALKLQVNKQRSYSQGGWGAEPHGKNPGTILEAHFPSTGIMIGSIGSLNTCSHTFWSASEIADFLPATRTPGKLNCSASTVEARLAAAGLFAGQVLALSINVKLSPAVIGGGAPFGGLVVNDTGTWADGKTVAAVLAYANDVLGGANPTVNGFSYSSLNSLVTQLNESFDSGVASSWALAHLSLP